VLNNAVPDFHCAQELIFYTKSFGINVSTSMLERTFPLKVLAEFQTKQTTKQRVAHAVKER
jgi:hypothetical protein